MKATIFFPILCCFASFLHAQLSIDFSNGNFQGWSGDSSKFTVVNEVLQLNDNTPSNSNQTYLSLLAPTGSETATTWEFLTNLSFSPSPTNYPRIYLAASQSNLRQALNGYFIQVGGINGDLDALQLCRQDGNNNVVLLSGRAGGVGTASVNVRVRVKRSTAGLWTLEADYNGGRNFETGGNIQDQTYPIGTYFGWICRYSATRNKSFSLDDIFIDPLFTDLTPPILLGVEAQNDQSIILRFNEVLDANTAAELNHYNLNPAAGSIVAAQRDTSNSNNIILTLSGKMKSLTAYTCTVAGIRDVFGNVSDVQTGRFSYLEISKAAEGDILISEIMANPTSAGNLPNVEYLELWNKSDKIIDLKELQISSGATPVGLGVGLFLPNTYYILCPLENVEEFRALGSVIGLTPFPGLSNTGDNLTLKTTGGLTLGQVNYTDDWYRDKAKAQGGWALELINANTSTDCPGNWAASVDRKGGTPGTINSINNRITDRSGPRVFTSVSLTGEELLVVFDEPLDQTTAEDLQYYALTEGISILDAILQPNKKEVILILATPLQSAKFYTLTLVAGIRDCLGNAQTRNQQILTGLPADLIEPGDLIVNEVLFNPRTSGFDFLEIYNNAQKLINLKNLKLINHQAEGKDSLNIIATNYLLTPGSYIPITESPQDILKNYIVKDSIALLPNAIPPFDDKEGNITLEYKGITLDSFNFSNKLHSPLLKEEDGISLERLNFDLPTNASGNWHSAATTVGGATPGYANSQFFYPDSANRAETIFHLEEAKFSPDGDGFQDVLLLPYQTNTPGYLANIIVFDINGRQVKRLVRNESLAVEGILKWDGTTDELLKARVGVYVIWIELFEPGGGKVLQKLSCVLAGKL